MKHETLYCLVLSESQTRYLATSKYGIDRMKALMSLIERASTEGRTYEKKGFSTQLRIGQVAMSEVELSRLWNCDRKTASRVLDTMNELKLVATKQNNRTSIHTLLCVSAWFINNHQVINPFYVKMKERFPEDESEADGHTANAVVKPMNATLAPAMSEQNDATSSDGNLPNSQTPVSANFTSADAPNIYNKVEKGNADGSNSYVELVSGAQQQITRNKPDLLDDSISNAVANRNASDGNANGSDGTIPPPTDSTPDIGLTSASVPDGTYHSMRDLQIDRLNQMGKL